MHHHRPLIIFDLFTARGVVIASIVTTSLMRALEITRDVQATFDFPVYVAKSSIHC